MGFLCYRCGEETDLFFQHKVHDPRYCYELFRRAILERDEQAWNCLYHRYEKLMIGWVERHSLFPAVDEDALVLVNRAFEKMWQGLTPEKFGGFPDLKSILRYLQMCVFSVVIDLSRAAERKRRLEEQAPTEAEESERRMVFSGDPCLEEQVYLNDRAVELWRRLDGHIKTPKERRVVYGMFVLAVKPAELKDLYPDSFKDVKEIYQVRDNLIARLRRDPDLKLLYDNA